MAELYRLQCRKGQGSIALILTDTQLLLQPDAEFQTSLYEELNNARTDVQEVKGLVGSLVGKVIDFASREVGRFLEPLPLSEVGLVVRDDEIDIRLGNRGLHFENLKVDRLEGYIFEAKLREAKAALGA